MPLLFASLLIAYFSVLVVIGYFTSRGANNASFFVGNRQSPWYLVAFGMIGASLSGVTFISVPGWVGDSSFSYFQLVLGYFPGYLFVAYVLLPIYYKYNLTSIYGYLEERFGVNSYKTGAIFFFVSRLIGSALRLFLVSIVLQTAVFKPLDIDIPFWIIVTLTVLLIWIYTFKGGIKTIVFTDTLQTFFLLTAVVIAIVALNKILVPPGESLLATVKNSGYADIFYFSDYKAGNYFWKQFLAGAFITIAMTGIDQDMMQKNLTCRTLKDAQKNMVVFAIILVFVNLLFLGLGALLYVYAETSSIPIPLKTDYLFPEIALSGQLGIWVAVFFVLGLIASAYSSADSALTALTTSFSVDLLNVEKKSERTAQTIRKYTHVGVSLLMIITILIFEKLNDDSVIATLFTIAGYTYGPLLGLFLFGIFSKFSIKDKAVPFICLLSPLLSYAIQWILLQQFGYKTSFELLIINALITIILLRLVRKKAALQTT
ncbi:MAG: sodium:solute symporter [Luteibaculaceae bacterium]